jgi:hypothetical protein
MRCVTRGVPDQGNFSSLRPGNFERSGQHPPSDVPTRTAVLEHSADVTDRVLEVLRSERNHRFDLINHRMDRMNDQMNGRLDQHLR